MTETQSRNIFSKLFLTSESPNRLRALWRLLLQTILMLLIGMMINFIFQSLFQNPSADKMLMNEIMLLIAITGSVFAAKKFLDNEPIINLGLDHQKKIFHDILVGIAISFFMMASIFVSLLVCKCITIEYVAWQTNSLISILLNLFLAFFMFSLVAWNEELLSRGYHLQTISDGTNRFWGILLSSSVFSFLHLLNPNHENQIMAVIGILCAGMFLALAYLRSGQLWLPIGLHLGWNFFQGVIFGFPVSGMNVYNLIKTKITGSSLLTGGTFGPESGLIILPAILLGSILIMIYTRKHVRYSQPV